MNELEQRKQDIVMLNELFDRFDKGTINDEYLSKLEYNGDRFKPFIFDVLYSIVNGENKEIDPRLCERYERLKNDNLIFKNLDLNKYGSLLYKSVIDIIGRGRLMLSIDIFMKLKSISKDAKFDFLLTGAEQYFLKYCGNFIDHVDRLYRQDGVEYSLNKIVEMINEFDFQFDDDGILQYYPIYNKTVEYTEQNQIDLQDFVNRYVNTNGKNGKFVKLINKFAPIFEKCKSYVKTNKEIYDVDSVSYLSYGIQGVIFKINKKNGEADVIKVICDKNCYEVDKSFFDLQKSNEKLFKDGGIIPYTYISGIEDEKYIVVTPYIEGGELKKEHLFEENKQILTNILNQFMYFHKNNIMHRDFKPLNVIDGNLIDFGSYYDYNKSENHPLEYNIESFEALVGTHGFSSPSLLRYFELDNNSSPLAESCALENKNAFSEDVWSLGVTIFYLLCNTRMIINFYKRPLGLYNQQEIFNFIDGLNIEDESRGELLNKYKELLRFILIVDEKKRPLMPEIAKKAKELGLTNNNLINFDNIEISNEVGKNMKEKDIEFINKKMNKVEELEKRVERLNVNLYRYRVMEEKIKTMKQRLEKISNEVKESKDNKPYLITFKDSNIANDIDNIEQESKKLFRTRVNADRYNKIGKEIERVVAIEEGLKRDIKRLYINRRGEDKEETERKSKQFYAKLVKYSEKKERLKKEFKRLSIKMDKNKKDIKTIKEWREKEKESKKRQNVVNNRQREEIE